MIVRNCFHLRPLLQNVRAQLVAAIFAEVCDLCLVRVALAAKVFKKNVDFKFFMQDFVVVFTNVFG